MKYLRKINEKITGKFINYKWIKLGDDKDFEKETKDFLNTSLDISYSIKDINFDSFISFGDKLSILPFDHKMRNKFELKELIVVYNVRIKFETLIGDGFNIQGKLSEFINFTESIQEYKEMTLTFVDYMKNLKGYEFKERGDESFFIITPEYVSINLYFIRKLTKKEMDELWIT